ncbi:LD-carboxypeptidase family protein [Listeria grandensis FSL F6-0971]|uniref:LD-carboxypeptidase family protein n=1 Tax=Listeria grandensis FSL F6-0971 TaxID=1265819 RepID=W7B6A5_9LIST|nr:LD-carboxypeptidase [Listeria grandensis]EUJ22809.1 LD-carboxypeptidase family protein [Listeria grandensis FSL F6-0971]
MLQSGDTIGLISCSNGRDPEREGDIAHIEELLFTNFMIKSERAATIFRTENELASGDPKERAEALMQLYQNPEIKAIFDISGGDLANEILPYLDFKQIQSANKPFIGYSDLTVIQNAIYAKTGIGGYNYQLLHMASDNSKRQLGQFKNNFIEANKQEIPYEILIDNGDIRGKIIGGNIRCLLKLAGTEYMPNFQGKVVVLEALSGDVAKIRTYLAQLDQIGVFQVANGVILGQFTEMQTKHLAPAVEDLTRSYVEKYNKFLLRTGMIGHHTSAEPFPIGFPLKNNF